MMYYMNGGSRDAHGVRGSLLIYSTTVVLCWLVPLFHQLNAFSMAALATVAFFTAGWAAVTAFRERATVEAVVRAQVGAIVWPLLLFGVAYLWTPVCGLMQGLLFWALFPLTTVIFAVAVAYALTGWRPTRARWYLCGAGLALIIAGPIYDLGLHPQFYTYNHVFGGVLGPIYDETLALRSGLFWFRGLTLCWAGGALLLGRWHRVGFPAPATGAWWMMGPPAVGALGVLIAALYAFASPLGFNTSTPYLEQQLSGRIVIDRVVLHYDPEALSAAEVAHWARYHAYQVERMEGMLDVTIATPVRSFLYPDEATKAALTGARTTNTAPVWLATPQIHVLQSAEERVVAHELVHAVSRSFGLPGVRASVSVGLVEGLAVALEPPSGRPSIHDQVVAAQLSAPGAPGQALNLDLSADVAARLSPFGFWTGRSAVSYTVMGSFVQYLLDAYGPAPLKEAYAWADFASAYGHALPQLTAEWQSFLSERPVVSRAARPVMAARFSRPSVFEQACPFQLSPADKAYREARAAQEEDRFADARRFAEEALAHQPTHQGARALWAAFQIAEGEAQEVVNHLQPIARERMAWHVQLRLAQALAAAGEAGEAEQQYDALLQRLSAHQHALWGHLQLQRALIDQPPVFRAIQLVHASAERAAQVAAAVGENATGRLLRALYHADAEEWTAALEAAPSDVTVAAAAGLPAGLARRLEAQMYAQRAAWAYRTGALAQAETEVSAAGQAFTVMGAAEAAAQARAFGLFLSWLETQPQTSFP
ncbi:MAG: hypothetical protein GVY12_09850 [Bacteroidetes bacterium]|jgi:tetratricopeptide (TPR) repeat protein|nr:hypothetical protein [Bacteroidota bacterium]